MKTDKVTYAFLKGSELMAFEGPREPIWQDFKSERGNEHAKKEVALIKWKLQMETAKSSALQVVNCDFNGKIFVPGVNLFAMKPGEVVPLEGWKVEKEYQIAYSTHRNSGYGKVSKEEYAHNAGFPKRIAYRLVRSEPEQKDLPQNGELFIGTA